ncbi:hypothetical protein [Patulibacter sp. SYSU D01012]|uniref:hypothetical protein n=1 Tax=Patulibacter sp. SYSU D01012 TaxID=2817381 RepID=UPI001B301078|nr:hypothetical protein [Patulibacter sp. SYSU D01012]
MPSSVRTPRLRLPRPRRPTRRRALAYAGALLVLALLVVAVGLKPAATAVVRSRLANRVGPVASLRIDGSPLDLLRRSPDAVAVHFAEATIGGDDGEGVGAGDALRSVPRLDLRADALDTGQFRFDDVAATVEHGTLHATAAVGEQSLAIRGQELPVTPRAVDGHLQLEIALGPISLPLAVEVQDGRPRVVVAGDGPLAGRELPMGAGGGLDGGGGGAVRLSRLGATERDGRVVLTVDGTAAA